MARRCELSGKGVLTGHNVSHSNIKTNRRYLPNVRQVRLISDVLGRTVKLRIAASTMRSIEHNNGFDNYIIKQPQKNLSVAARRLQRDIKKALAAKQATGTMETSAD